MHNKIPDSERNKKMEQSYSDISQLFAQIYKFMTQTEKLYKLNYRLDKNFACLKYMNK